jgi:archaellum component FlaF (FlaF/FlaG flagellin family)
MEKAAELSKIKFYGCIILIGTITSLIIYGVFYLIAPQHYSNITEADSVSIANTYIVFTTLLVTLFAVMVAVITFWSAKVSTKAKLLELENAFVEHLASNDKFAERLMNMAAKHVNDQIDHQTNGQTFQRLKQLLIDEATKGIRDALSLENELSTLRQPGAQNGTA